MRVIRTGVAMAEEYRRDCWWLDYEGQRIGAILGFSSDETLRVLQVMAGVLEDRKRVSIPQR